MQDEDIVGYLLNREPNCFDRCCIVGKSEKNPRTDDPNQRIVATQLEGAPSQFDAGFSIAVSERRLAK
jgi:hypothetical protein